MIDYNHQTKTLIDFWCMRDLNLRFLIQPSETLLIELTKTHILIIRYSSTQKECNPINE